MQPTLEVAASETAQLRRCLNDLVSVMALPALWTGAEPPRIASTLLEALHEMLRLDFVFVRLEHPEGGPTRDMARIGPRLERNATAPSIARALDGSLGSTPSEWPSSARVSIAGEDVCVAVARLGVQGEFGTVVVGSERSDFPRQTERLLLDTAANQATIGLQQARLLAEQRRLSETLDERVAQRTSELAAANAALTAEIVERRRVEEALRESEREARLIVDGIPGLVALLSPTGGVDVVNRQLMEYFGQTLEELRRWQMADTVHPEDLPHVIEVFTQGITTGSPYQIVQRFRRSDGVYRWFENRGFPLRDPEGRITRWCVLLTDINERKRAEEALRESERELRLIVDSIPAMICVLSAGGELDFMNRRGLEYFGLTLADMQRWQTGVLTHPEDLARGVERFARSLAAGVPWDVEVRALRFDGVYRWTQTRGVPLRDADGRILRWYILIVDIDEQKRAEGALAASERNLKLIIDTMPALAWSTTADGAADYFNRHYLEYVGLSTEQAGGWGWTAVVHPEDIDGLAETWQGCLRDGASGEAEARMRRHDGEYRWFLFRTNPLRDESGTIVKWYGVNTDIEDRKRAESELRRAYSYLTEAQRLSRTGSFFSDFSTGERVWSDELYRILEVDGAVRPGNQSLRPMVHPDDLPSYDAMAARLVAGHDLEYGFRIITARGAVKHLRSVAHIVEWKGGHPVVFGAVQDVTESVAAEEALHRARSELAHVARVSTLSTLSASIAHEVNQPLSGIITNSSTCLRMLDADPPNVDGARETARRAIRDGRRAADVITRLRAMFSRKEFALESLDLSEAVREVLALSANDLQQHRVMVELDLADDLPRVVGDRVQLQQVILNLLRNATEAMADVDDRPRKLQLRTEREDGDRVRVTVRDSGVGIDAGSENKLFDAFYTTKSGGMGIGLSVSRSIVERHHGRLWAAPNEGPGVTFAFSVPCRALEGEDASR